MDTLSSTMNELRKRGYVEDFNLNKYGLKQKNGHLQLTPKEFIIDEVYRFEGMTDPDDEAILYAVSSDKYQLKGILVNGYGIYSDALTDQLLEKLKMRKVLLTE
ncbi:phosphoribosylpyrophosphate synthetase [Catalinimonas niigatensis]|uniref:phosphoribosylpyrophosphate synthetase n=1 Tax=Catalinimonas niigatensis TaxID=1397264 RepID=UPI002666B3F7|nr:phosphoribosylpyrophosphate synthetase [Catalinimonas niigatensis]WPP49819.1 phosphoribosylpyrophosphate synthetase [Catalinimonas niigatensis]